jgi:hypothetical protein
MRRRVTTNEYKPGQRWSYRTLPGDESSSLIIARLDPPDMPATNPRKGTSIPWREDGVHIIVVGLDIARGFSGTAHTPISRGALDASVLAILEADVEVPASFEEAYLAWAAADGAGYWTCEVAKVVEYARSALAASR